MKSGLFIVLEGIDGAGKTEQARGVGEWLRGRGHDVVETREPTDGAWGRRYRSWARGETEATADEVLAFFVEDRVEHVARVIRPALAKGAVVVCDRYHDSTLAYQAAQGVDRAKLDALADARALPRPDLVLWLRLPIAQALERFGAQATERFERAGFLERVDAEYARLGLEPLDASGARDAVQAALRARIEPLLARASAGV